MFYPLSINHKRFVLNIKLSNSLFELCVVVSQLYACYVDVIQPMECKDLMEHDNAANQTVR